MKNFGLNNENKIFVKYDNLIFNYDFKNSKIIIENKDNNRKYSLKMNLYNNLVMNNYNHYSMLMYAKEIE